jgi:thiamine monophosphate kinase
MNEEKMIGLFARIHNLVPFGADAERFGEMIFSMDSFSENEDFFENTPPEIIGNNMAAAACSDLLASGAVPQFLLQTWNIDEAKPEHFYTQIAAAIENVLHHYGAVCIGGDLGTSSPWNWTATVGAQKTAPVRRIAARQTAFDLYLSGTVGDANLAVATGKPMPGFELREAVPANSLFATDTSGGFLDALENFRRVNKDISIELGDIPLPETGDLPFPPELLLIGGVGEYELLYAVPAGEKAPGIHIGSGDFSGKGITFARGGKMLAPPPDYRNIPQAKWFDETYRYYVETFEVKK